MEAFRVVIQKWEESEAGWGTRPDGISIHTTMEECKKFRTQFWENEKKRNPSGVTPNEYSREDGEPFEVIIVSDEIKVALEDMNLFGVGSVNLYHNHPIERMIMNALLERKI